MYVFVIIYTTFECKTLIKKPENWKIMQIESTDAFTVGVLLLIFS